jgi:CheY-like chemotaxis protein
MIWEERNGPSAVAPYQRGFGSTLIERTLSGHGGEATIQYKNTGVTCQITMPLPELSLSPGTPASAEDHSTFDPGADGALGLQGTRVIVVEDEPLVALDMESILIAAGCEIAGSAGSLEKAKALVARAQFDVALLDVNLGGDSVGELAAELTQRNVPFAFVTGYGREALPKGFQDMVAVRKPASQKELVAVVQRLVSGTAHKAFPRPTEGPLKRLHASHKPQA